MRILCYALMLLCVSCIKRTDDLLPVNPPTEPLFFTQFTIRSGQHYSGQSTLKIIETGELRFTVKFDSSAIYQTKLKENQYDINKLYGFSDNNSDHHQFSARFGWRWSDNALRLFAYVYNKGKMTSKELGTVPIGSEVVCSIKVTENSYIFTLNNKAETMPRMSTTPKGKGYQLYPYFGGNETAPHDIHIWIKG